MMVVEEGGRPPPQLGPEAWPVLRAGVDHGVEVQDRERLSHLAAVGAAFELVQLERPLWPTSQLAHPDSRAAAGQRGRQRGRDIEDADHGR